MSSHGPHAFYIFIVLNYVKFPAPIVGVNVFFNITYSKGTMVLTPVLTMNPPLKPYGQSTS
jgi:hypothetical protein